MRSGALRNPLDIVRRVQMGVDAHNAPNFVDQTWRENVLSEVTVVRGREHFDQQSKQRYSEDVWHFRVRYVEVIGLDASMFIHHDNMVFDIKATRPDGQKQQDVIIECVLQKGALSGTALMAFMTENVPDGAAGVVYDGFTVEARGGTAPYTFAVTSGTLPGGLALNGATGIVSGTPLAAGTAAGIVFTVTDAGGETSDLPSVDVAVS